MPHWRVSREVHFARHDRAPEPTYTTIQSDGKTKTGFRHRATTSHSHPLQAAPHCQPLTITLFYPLIP
jgi:hypothetical protein